MDLLAIWGAIVGTISLSWQIGSRLVEKRTRLKVEVYPLPPDEPSLLEVYCINRSEHEVHTIGLSFAHADDESRSEVHVGSDPIAFRVEAFSTVIPPRDAINGVLMLGEFMELDLDMTKPIVAIVQTANDKKFRSKPFVPTEIR